VTADVPRTKNDRLLIITASGFIPQFPCRCNWSCSQITLSRPFWWRFVHRLSLQKNITKFAGGYGTFQLIVITIVATIIVQATEQQEKITIIGWYKSNALEATYSCSSFHCL